MGAQSMHAVVGSDWDRPLPAVTYTQPKAKPTGLDWSKHRAPEPEPPPVVERPEATVTEIRRRVTTPRPRAKVLCACGNTRSAQADQCRKCHLASRPARTSIVDLRIARTEYESGATCPEIAATHGWPVVSVRRQLAKAGVTMRDDRGGKSGGQNAIENRDPALVDRIRTLYVDQGMSQREVALELGLSPKGVRNVMKRAAIPAREGQSGGGNTLKGYSDRLAGMGVTGALVRAWARGNGIPVGVRGAIPSHVLDAFEHAHPTTQEGTS